MLILLSPAKTLDFDPSPLPTYSEPRLLDETGGLIEVMRGKTASDVKSLMKVSDAIAELNVQRYRDYRRDHVLGGNAKQALLAFKGDVYRDWSWPEYSDEDFAFAQAHVRILSGLYGVLRPLDLMQPYRLEMGTRLKTERGRNLYDYWGERITSLLNEDIASSGSPLVVNLASNEYYHSVKPAKLDVPVVAPVFRDLKNGVYKIISFYAKRARGAMADWLVTHRATDADSLRAFDGLGYRFDPERSTDAAPTFIREP